MKLRTIRIILLVLLALEIVLLVIGPQAKDHLPQIEAALANKEKPGWWDDAAMGVRYAAWINAGLIGSLLLTLKWWTRSFAQSEVQSPEFRVQSPRWFWPSLIGAAIVCLGLRLPRAARKVIAIGNIRSALPKSRSRQRLRIARQELPHRPAIASTVAVQSKCLSRSTYS